MRSTFNILFYVNKSKEKNGVVPIMGRVTINGTQSQFSCKKSIPLELWDVKGNCAKGRVNDKSGIAGFSLTTNLIVFSFLSLSVSATTLMLVFPL